MKFRLALTATDRVRYFTQVAASWAAVPDVADWSAHVYCEPTESTEAMLEQALAIPGATAVLNPTRYGVLHNPWRALAASFDAGADFVVLAEDDVLVSTDVLDLMAWAAHALADDERMLAVRACSFFEHCDPADEHVLVAAPEFCPLVWGTWATRWTTVLRDTWDHDYTSGTPEAPSSGWDWNINLRLIPAGGYLVAQPKASRSTHIGVQGIHTTPASYPASVARTWRPERERVPPGVWSIR